MNKSILMISALAATMSLAACDVEKTQEGNVTLPTYEKTKEGDVTVPKYDVDAPEVKVETKEKTVTVPTVEVTPANEK